RRRYAVAFRDIRWRTGSVVGDQAHLADEASVRPEPCGQYVAMAARRRDVYIRRARSREYGPVPREQRNATIESFDHPHDVTHDTELGHALELTRPLARPAEPLQQLTLRRVDTDL